MSDRKNHTPWYLWPFKVLFDLVAWIIGLTGRIIGMLLGLVFVILGIILTTTIVGACIGIPLALFGLLIMLRSIF